MKLDIQRAETNGIMIAERGKGADGEVLTSNRRLFMQLLVFTGCHDTNEVIAALAESDMAGTVYADLNDPYGVGLLTWSESPDFFVGNLRPFLQTAPFTSLTPRPSLTMFGRTYTIGYEPDLDEALIKRPMSRVTNLDIPWAIWYPLRRKGSFEQLGAKEQRTILMEHGGIGRAYGRAGLGTDIRLACHGLDQQDNDFVIGLIGKELTSLSKIVERMRKTKQTSEYLASLGPFFIGKAIYTKK
ncbi:MAG: chlorite dismutase family protein [Chloroflexota bacterium]